MYPRIKNKVSRSIPLKVRARTVRTATHTETNATERIITTPHSRAVTIIRMYSSMLDMFDGVRLDLFTYAEHDDNGNSRGEWRSSLATTVPSASHTTRTCYLR